MSYPATRPACAARCRVRQFSLAPLRPFGTPQQPACGQRFYGRPQPLGESGYSHFRRQGFPFPRRMPLPRLARANVAQILDLCSAVHFRPRDDRRPGMGSKGVLQLPAPRCSRASTFPCTRLQQSALLARKSVEPSGSLASCRGGGSPRHGSVTAGGHPVWQYTSVNAYSDQPVTTLEVLRAPSISSAWQAIGGWQSDADLKSGRF